MTADNNLSKYKGDILERAVEQIEYQIIKTNPSFKYADFTIEKNKFITVNGVKHEIDIYINIIHGFDYDSVFIFECKNWSKNIGKNEIINFEKKIDVTNAQKGFFIAKSFGKYAIAEANNNDRLILVKATELGLNDFFIKGFHAVYNHKRDLNIKVEIETDSGKCKEPSILHEGSFKIDEDEINFNDFVFKKIDVLVANKTDKLPTDRMNEGEHIIEIDEAISVMDDSLYHTHYGRITKIRINFQYKLFIVFPRLIYAYYIENRGRNFKLITDIPYIRNHRVL